MKISKSKIKVLFLSFLLVFSVNQESLTAIEVSTKTARIIDGVAFFGSLFGISAGCAIVSTRSNPLIEELIFFSTFVGSLTIFYFVHKYIHTITPTGKFLRKFHAKFDQLYSEESIKPLLNHSEEISEFLNKNRHSRVEIKKRIEGYIELFESLLKEITPELKKDAKFYEDADLELGSTICKVNNILSMLKNILNSLG